MLKLVKVLWILIVCQCFYHSSAGKKNPSESDSNNIVPCHCYSCGVDFPVYS